MAPMDEFLVQNPGRKVFMTGTEGDGIYVYCRVVEGQEFFRIEYVCDAGFQSEEEIDEMNRKEPRYIWSIDLEDSLRTVRMPWFLFSFMVFEPDFVERILTIRSKFLMEKGKEIRVPKPEQVRYFSNFE